MVEGRAARRQVESWEAASSMAVKAMVVTAAVKSAVAAWEVAMAWEETAIREG